jgi:hypothetical protein
VQEIRREWTYESSEAKKFLSPLADLLHLWATSERFTDASGRPVHLTSGEGSIGSFEELVGECMGDVPPGAVKAELQRLGAITVSPDNELVLKRRSLIPEDLESRLESALVYSLRGLADTIAHNIDPAVNEADRRFERFVESRPLAESELSQIKEIVRARLTRQSEEFDMLLNSEPCTDPDEPRRRVGIGLYFSE